MRTIIVVFLAVFSSYSSLAHGDWPDWRGPTADGRSDATGLPVTWSETENIAWKIPIHDMGFSTPVVLGDQIWLTTAKEDGQGLYAICIDVDSGAIVHDIEVFRPDEPQKIHPQNTYATPSIAVEGGRVYVHFGTFGTACLDSETGQELWRRTDIHCDHMQGPVSSPVLFDDLVILDLEGVDAQFMIALDKQSGDTVWRAKRSPEFYGEAVKYYAKKAYHTPIIVDVDGEPQLVSNGAQLVSGHDPRTGEVLWRVVYRDDNTISRVVSGHGLFFVNCGAGKNRLWAVRHGGSGNVTDSHVVWKADKDMPLESSPVLVDDLLYLVSDRGVLSCLEATTGETVWTEQLTGKYGASLLYADNRIYVSNKKGKTTVFEPGRSFRAVAVNDLDGSFWASPAVADESLLLRTTTHLYRIQDQ